MGQRGAGSGTLGRMGGLSGRRQRPVRPWMGSSRNRDLSRSPLRVSRASSDPDRAAVRRV